MDEAANAYIALGSNLGDRANLIRDALACLGEHPGIEVSRVSTLIETKAVGPGPQPGYLNAAASLRTTLMAHALLEELLAVERTLGRNREMEPRWGPRLIDLDLLLYADAVIDEPGITLPHPRMHERDFVLEPLAEIAPQVVHPVLGLTVERLWRDFAASKTRTT